MNFGGADLGGARGAGAYVVAPCIGAVNYGDVANLGLEDSG